MSDNDQPKAELRRDQVAARLGVSARTVERLEKDGRLHAERDERGRVLYDAAEVEQLAAERGVSHSPATSDEGALAARAFSILASGRGPRDLVIELELLPARAAELHREWTLLGRAALLIDEKQRQRLEETLGGEVDARAVTRLALLGAVAIPVLNSLIVSCSSCGARCYLGASWRSVLAHGEWLCSRCEDEPPT